MGLFSWLMPDLTRTWPASGPGAITLDLRKGSVAGVALGSSWQSLEQLGRPSRRMSKPRGSFTYPLRGFEADVAGPPDRVVAYGLVFRRCSAPVDSEEGFTPCRVRVVLPDGMTEGLWSAATTEEDVRALLGAPRHEKSSDDDEEDQFWVRTLEYAYPACLVSLEFDRSRRIVCVDVDMPQEEDSP